MHADHRCGVPAGRLCEEVGRAAFPRYRAGDQCGGGLSLIVSVTVVPTAAARLLSATQTRRWRPARRTLPVDRAAFSSIRLDGQPPLPVRADPLRGRLAGRRSDRRPGGLGQLRPCCRRSSTCRTATATSCLASCCRRRATTSIKLMRLGDVVEERLKPYWDVDPGTPEAAALDAPSDRRLFLCGPRAIVFLGLRALDPLAAELVPLVRAMAAAVCRAPSRSPSKSSLFERGSDRGRRSTSRLPGRI